MKQSMFYIFAAVVRAILKNILFAIKTCRFQTVFKETAKSTFFPAKSLILYLTNKQVTGQYIVLQYFL